MKEGEFINLGDVICKVETDKSVVSIAVNFIHISRLFGNISIAYIGD